MQKPLLAELGIAEKRRSFRQEGRLPEAKHEKMRKMHFVKLWSCVEEPASNQ
jgi:hypothetical protein